jgi:hypothetical protein
MSDVRQLEQQISNVKELMALRDKMLQLGKIPLFKELILDKFCIEEAARLVGQSADPALSPQQRSDALSMAQAGGHVRRWLSLGCRMGDQAESDLVDIEQMLAEARAEEDNSQDEDSFADETDGDMA